MKDMEEPMGEENQLRGKRTKTKGILKNPSERHSRKHRKHSSSSSGSGSGSGRHVEISVDQQQPEKRHRHKKHRDSSNNIYDTPKVTSVKWKEDLTAAYERTLSARNERAIAAVNTSLISGEEEEMVFYENLNFTESRSEEQLYDVPRSTNTEAIYINQNFEDDIQTYDRPRKTGNDDFAEEDHIECDYDVPKVRDGVLSPIDEEQSLYDVPRVPRRDEDNIYENQDYRQELNEPIYMNEVSDDRSSGYRSSPSLNSEDNLGSAPSTPESGGMFGSREDVSAVNLRGIDTRFNVDSEEPLVTERHDVAIDTSSTLERQYQESTRERQIQEAARERQIKEAAREQQIKEAARERQIREAAREQQVREAAAKERQLKEATKDQQTKEKQGVSREQLLEVHLSKRTEASKIKDFEAVVGSDQIQVEFEEFDPEDSLKRKQFSVEKKLKETELLRSATDLDRKKAKPRQTSFAERFNTSRPASGSLRSNSSAEIKPVAKDPAPPNSVQTVDKVESIKKRFEKNKGGPEEPKKEVVEKNNDKNSKDRDRSVDVYHETVRQRTVKDKKQVTPDLFRSQTKSIKMNKEKKKEESGETGLPSVRKLLAKFENSHPQPPMPANQVVNKVVKQTIKEDHRNMATVQTEKRGIEMTGSVEPLQSPPLVSTNKKSDACSGDEKAGKAKWDPQMFVRSLYNLPVLDEPANLEEDGPVSLDSSSSCPSIEGYMEKLPAGRKRPTMWNSWKKHYFVARNGVLHIYNNKSQTELLEKLELFGGQVDFMDSNMLGLEDRKGQYVVVRCASHKATQEWESALSFHTQESYSKTFISPLPVPREIKVMSNIVVVDLGGASIRAGIGGPSPYLPMLFFPSLMAVNPDNQHEKFFGFDVLKAEVRSRFVIHSPLLPAKSIDKYSVDLVALCGLLLKVFQDLRVDPKKCELQLSVPRNFNAKTKLAIAALLFDEFEVRAVNMGHQSVFTLHSYNTNTGVVVDIGERMDVVPIVSGYKVQSGLSRSTTGGMELCGHMRHALLGRNYSLTSFLDTFMVRQVVERLCYLARNFDAEYDTYGGEEKAVNLSQGSKISTVTLGTERFQITEGIFKPELWGLDQAGVHVLVKKAISECSLDVRKEVSQSIYLGGGLTLIPGFKHRLEVELAKILPVRPRVHASPYRYHAAYLGACAHAISPAYDCSKITRTQWIEGKADVAASWVL